MVQYLYYIGTKKKKKTIYTVISFTDIICFNLLYSYICVLLKKYYINNMLVKIV